MNINMEKDELLKDILINLQKLDTVESEIAMIEIAKFQKNIDKIKKEKIEEIKEYFNQYTKHYNQKNEKYQIIINKNIKQYENQIDKLINAYEDLYMKTFKMMYNAINNQKIAISNIITLSKNISKPDIKIEDRNVYERKRIGCAQKKLDYAVIIEACHARLKWCIENVQIDIKQIFDLKTNQTYLTKNNIFTKLRIFISNKIFENQRNFKA